MGWNIRPVLSALLRNRTGAVLVAVQIAIALAVLVNAVYIVHQRIEKMHAPTGVDWRNEFWVQSEGFTSRFKAEPSMREDVRYLRSLDGVVDATPANSVPMGWSNQSTYLFTNPNQKGAQLSVSFYAMDEHGLNTLGAHLIAGRAFRADEILPPVEAQNATDFVPEVIATQSLAKLMFPGTNALGKVVYDDAGHAATIIGIINDVIAPSWSVLQGWNHVMLIPRTSTMYGIGYLVRTVPGRRDAIMSQVEQHLAASNPDRVINEVRSLEFFRNRLYREDRNMEVFLITVTLLVITICCVGIFGLATFNVSTRTKQIGTRRAVGGRRLDIIHYFMIENALITTAGVVVGCALALAVGYWLSLRYQLPRLDLYYLVGGILVLWFIGQLAVWQPARRAAAVPPSVATRTV